MNGGKIGSANNTPLPERMLLGGLSLVMVFWLVYSIFFQPKLDTISLCTAKIDYASIFTCFPDSGLGPDENRMEIKYCNRSMKPGDITFTIPPVNSLKWQKKRPAYHRLLFRLGWNPTDVHLRQITLNRHIFFVDFPFVKYDSKQIDRIVSDHMSHKTRTTLTNGVVTLSSKLKFLFEKVANIQ